MQELGLYANYYYRRENKVLVQLLKEDETLNCMLTGVNSGNRKMVAITDSRIIIIFAGALGSGDVKVLKRDAVTSYGYEKGLFPSVFIETGSERFDFTNTQHGLRELFDWAMTRPLPEPDPQQ